MRCFAVSALTLVCLVQTASAQEITQILTPPGAKKATDASSYGLGYDIGMNIASNGITAADVSQADLLAGLLDALSGKEPAVEAAQIQAAMQALSRKLMARRQQAAENNLATAAKFLADNKAKDGVQTTESGLQYQVLKSGAGATPKANNSVTVHYEGKLLNGEVFDSSIARGEPISFEVTGVIPGWTEALQRMKVGDKWKLFIPPNLAYRENGSPPAIGPNELLIFEVELLQVQ